MIELAQNILGTQPILAIFLAIGVGYLVGQINLGGFSLGVGAVLFVGLAIGAFAPKSQIVGPIGLTGLIMFLYGIGILYGKQFFQGMSGAAGIKSNLLALVAVLAGLFMALALGQAFGIKIGHTLGIYAGSMTSTATLQAALDVMRNSEPSIGYSIAYPFGVIGPILCIYFMTRHVQPKFPPKAQRFHMAEITLGSGHLGQRLHELEKALPEGVQVTMVRKGDQNVVPTGDMVLASGDGLMVVAESQEAVAEAAAALGRLEPGRLVKDRSALDYIRVFVGKASMVGIPLAQLPLPAGFPVHLLHVRRYDADIVPTPDLTLEFGDRVGVLLPPERKQEVRQYFGELGEVDRRVQLCIARHRNGSWCPARADPDPGSWRGDGHARYRRWSADCCTHLRLSAQDRPVALGDAAAGQHRLEKFWPCNLFGRSRHQRRSTVRANVGREWIDDAVHRHDGVADDRAHRSACRVLSYENPL